MKPSNPIHRFSNRITPHLLNEFYEVVGERIVSKPKRKDSIYIMVNKSFLIWWGLSFLGMGIVVLVFFLGNASFKPSAGSIGMIVAFSLPFKVVGGAYLYRASRDKFWTIDLTQQAFVFDAQKRLPFEQVIKMGVTHLRSASPYGGTYSYHLNVLLKNGSTISLLKNEDLGQMHKVMLYFNSCTGLPADLEPREA